MMLLESRLSSSQAVKGYLNLKRFVLVAALFVLGGPNDRHVVDQLTVLVILHAESGKCLTTPSPEGCLI